MDNLKSCEWKAQLANSIRDAERLRDFFPVEDDEVALCEELKKRRILPFLATFHFASLLKNLYEKSRESDFLALRRQLIPSLGELRFAENELSDPLGGEKHLAAQKLIHQYKNRVLALTCGVCFAHCRYCFRRVFVEKSQGFLSDSELDEICAYLRAHGEVKEILLSGGDVLFADDEKIFALLSRLRKCRADLLFRVCTRANVFLPKRFTADLLKILREFRPLWLIPHINCAAELCDETVASLKACVDAGIPTQSQTVLLRGVNDSVQSLAALFNALVFIGVKPGYLFQTDLAQGTAHFRVPMERAIRLYDALRAELSGLSLPTFAVDLPGGGGKFNLLQLRCFDKISQTDNSFVFERRNGAKFFYPKD